MIPKYLKSGDLIDLRREFGTKYLGVTAMLTLFTTEGRVYIYPDDILSILFVAYVENAFLTLCITTKYGACVCGEL